VVPAVVEKTVVPVVAEHPAGLPVIFIYQYLLTREM
jgi:hypothetical protein